MGWAGFLISITFRAAGSTTASGESGTTLIASIARISAPAEFWRDI